MNLLLVGGTGTIGSAFLKSVVNDKAVNTTLLLRNPEKFTSEYENLNLIKADLADIDSLKKALEGIDVVFLNSTPSPDMIKLQCNMIDACAEIGDKKIIRISVVGASDDGSKLPELSDSIISRWHSEIEVYARDKNVPSVQVKPSFLMQNFRNFLDSMRSENTIYAAAGTGKIVPVDVNDVGKAINALLHVKKPVTEYVITGGESLTFTQMAKYISDACGKEIKYVDLNPKELRQAMLDAGKPEWLANIMSQIFDSYRSGHGDFTSPDFTELTTQYPTTFSEFAKTLEL